MSIQKYIQVTDENIPPKVIGQFIKYANTLSFREGEILSENSEVQTNKSVRDVGVFPLSKYTKELTLTHWNNLMEYIFKKNFKEYVKVYPEASYRTLTEISLLKYQDKGFYKYHVDHDAKIPRTFSCVILLNNDYKGGELCFWDTFAKEEIKISTSPGRVILWPSNFIFPHKINPVIEGTRYSVVLWAL